MKINHNGRQYNVLATFPDTDEGTKNANLFMEINKSASLLKLGGGVLYLADTEDKGVNWGVGRFSIEQEMDDEPVYITDDATDPDDEKHSIITIEAHYATPQLRSRVAKKIKALLEEIARNGDENRVDGFKTDLPE